MTPLETTLGEALEWVSSGMRDSMPLPEAICVRVDVALALYREAKESHEARDKRWADAAEAASKDPAYLATLIDQGAKPPESIEKTLSNIAGGK